MKAPREVKYPPPRFTNGLINYGMITDEVAEHVDFLELIGNDPEVIQKRDEPKKRYYGQFCPEAPANDLNEDDEDCRLFILLVNVLLIINRLGSFVSCAYNLFNESY